MTKRHNSHFGDAGTETEAKDWLKPKRERVGWRVAFLRISGTFLAILIIIGCIGAYGALTREGPTPTPNLAWNRLTTTLTTFFTQLGTSSPSSASIAEPVDTPIPGAADSTPLEIGDISDSDVTDTSAVISWRTNRASGGQVEYGASEALGGATPSDQTSAISHRAELTALAPNTTYHYKVVSTDESGNPVTSYAREFTTLRQADTTPPEISAIRVSTRTDVSATIEWSTKEEATSHVQYGRTADYGSTTTLDERLTTSHSVRLPELEPNTEYHFRVLSTDESGNSSESRDESFKTVRPISEGHEIGKRAPGFEFMSYVDRNNPNSPNNGQPVRLSDSRGNKVLLNFWSTFCGACLLEFPDIRQVYKAHLDEGDVDVITMCIDGREDRIEKLETKFDDEVGRFTFPILLDPDGETKDTYNLWRIPKTVFIDSDGIIRHVEIGRFDSADQIEEILKGIQ